MAGGAQRSSWAVKVRIFSACCLFNFFLYLTKTCLKHISFEQGRIIGALKLHPPKRGLAKKFDNHWSKVIKCKIHEHEAH